MENVKILFFNLPENLPLVGELIEHYQKKEGFDAQIVTDQNIVTKNIIEANNGIVVFKVENKPDLQAAVTLLKIHKKMLRKGQVKFACLAYFKSKKVEGILQKFGCKDILGPSKIFAPRLLVLKWTFGPKIFSAQLRKVDKELSLKPNSQEGTSSDLAQRPPVLEDFTYVAPLRVGSGHLDSKAQK